IGTSTYILVYPCIRCVSFIGNFSLRYLQFKCLQ
ncbi:unnamed protein product, partial [Tenebrio molitor]